MDLLLINANIYTLSNSSKKPKIKDEMNELSISENSAIAIDSGVIKDIGKTEVLLEKYKGVTRDIVDVGGRALLPGFVDPHTHSVFLGTREQEFRIRLEGKTYIEILQAGGGILSTVENIRKASVEEIATDLAKRVKTFFQYGTTTFEAKSGYGLDFENEIKMLKAIKMVNDVGDAQIIPTFLGAHALPKEYKGNSKKYVELLINDMLPYIAENKLADFIDVFCEEGVFSPAETEKILLSGIELGLKAKIHSDEIKAIGCSELAEKLRLVSCDHLLKINGSGLRALKMGESIATLLPGTAFSLRERYAPAREIIDYGIPVAIATDCNPGSSYTESMPMIITLAVINMGMSVNEAISAATVNAAFAVQKQEQIGSIEISKQADFVILKENSHIFIPYHYGVNPVWCTYKRGKRVYDSEVGMC
ncbi:imidazolonepropionase [Thermodesulfobium sp. 4217-1]|uniref:imidazolonepropionase n=1 Tax=Thermodesulfobium sp. 4217-1 TaxID=3120013 RepID=UPI003221E403